MNRSSRKSLLTVRERVVLHLLAYQRYLQDSDAPAAITQEGIADAVDVGRNNVSKVVNSLGELGSIEVQTKHVKGYASIKKVYFLTANGYQEALSLKAELERTKINIVDFDGKVHEDELGKLPLYLPKRYAFLDLALNISRGHFDCSSFHESKVKEERRFVDYTDRKPTIRTFFGRQKELKALNEFLDSGTARVMAICGIPGIGKTTLLAKFVQDIRDQRNVYWYRVHEWVNIKILLTPIAEFLSQLGKKGLERYLSRTEGPSVGEVCTILEMELKDLPTVFIIDDVQKGEPSVQELLAALVGVMEGLEHVCMICTSREIPSFYTRSAVVKGVVQEMMLEGLDVDSSLRLMRNRELPENELMDIYRATRGHPLFLELVDSPKSALGKNVRMFIEQEVYSKLDITERRILDIASVFRYPVLVDAFFTMEEEIAKDLGVVQKEMEYTDYLVDYDTIDALLSKSLLNESLGRMIGMHDLLRDFFYSRLPPRQRISYHKAASRYYLQDTSAPAHVEALYHCLMAKEHSTAIRIAASNGRDIISKGYGLPFAPLLSTLREQCDHIDRSEKMELLLLEGDILEVKGEWDQAISRFQEIIDISEVQQDRRLLAEVNRRIGVIYLRRSAFDKAEEYLVRSLELAKDVRDPHTLVETYYDLGGVLQNRGRHQDAMTAFHRSMELAQNNLDDMGLGMALYGIGRVLSSLLDHQQAIKYKKEALEVIERTGDVDNIARICIGLGTSLAEVHRYAEAVKYHERAVEMGRTSGNLELQGYALRNAVVVYVEMDELDRAQEYINLATKIFEKLNNQILMADMHLMRGYIYNKKMEWEWAKVEFTDALGTIRRMDAPLLLGRWLFEIAQQFIKNGDRAGATDLLNEALLISTHGSADNLKKEVEEALLSISA
ncbi:MAG: tetratricopeptide repeat protein [Methanomassiliicoccus sp.]|nr:tetratricopeptide repeat protein [Methanomassiliicoccus sp.]